MKKKGNKQLNGNLAPMHTVGEANGAYVSVFPAVQPEAAVAEAKPEKKKPVAVGYRIVSALLLLLSVGGLFLGLVCSAVSALEPFSAFRAVFTESAIGNSILGLFLEIFRNFAVYSEGLGNKLFLAVLFFFALCVLVSVACSLTAFFAGKKAKTCAHVNATALFLGYGALFITNFAQTNVLFSSPELGFAKQMFDLPSAVIAGLSLIILLALVFSDRREKAASAGGKCFQFLMLALLLGVMLAFFYPGTATAKYMILFRAGLFSANGVWCGVAVLLVAVLFAFNFLVTAIRLNFKKSYAFDAVRYGLQLCALVFFLVMAKDRAIFTQKLPAVIGVIAAAFLLFILPLLVALLSDLHKKEVKDAQFAEEANALTEDELSVGEAASEDEQPAVILPPAEENPEEPEQPDLSGTEAILGEAQTEPDPKEQYIDEFVAEMIQSEKEETTMIEPTDETFNGTLNDDLQDDTLDETLHDIPAEQPVYAMPETQTDENREESQEEIIVFTADNFDPNNPMLLPTSGEPSEAIGAGASLWAGMPPVRERIVEKIVEVEKKKPKVELTEFEKQMAEQAKERVTPVNEAAYDTLPYADGARQNQPIIQQTFITNPAAQTAAPATAPAAAAAPAPATPVAPAPSVPVPDFTDRIERERRDRYDPQYTYDPFINTLTPEERSEFGDVFISHRHGIQNYLPAYVIGGDNRKFFRLLFVHLGRYREFISQNLMDKMYAFVSSKK